MQFIGVDVGTQSVRAALVNEKGVVLKTAVRDIDTYNPQPQFYEQSSEQIWNACCKVVKEVAKDAEKIRGLGFDATCSLVILDEEEAPLTVSPTGKPEQNVILWMDHRAVEQAALINETQDDVLRFVGGQISPEMQPPKLLWLKQNMPETWEKLGYAFDLPDFLTWKATGSDTRSLCSVVCKWTYRAGNSEEKGWKDSFWIQIGLADIVDGGYKKIGTSFAAPGFPCGKGLSKKAALQLGLKPGLPVATSIIDAHAGGIGLLGCEVDDDYHKSFSRRLAVIAGTSTCHMLANENSIFTPGVWGPYFSAMVPGMWLSEAGQSAAGSLIQHIINSHKAFPAIAAKTKPDRHTEDTLNWMLGQICMKRRLPSISLVATNLHVWPDFHGNRSPVADPNLRGMVCGLTLDSDEEDLACLYLATVQGLAYSTRHILDSLRQTGHSVSIILLCGGLSKNPLYVQMHADITGLPVLLPSEPESVLLGSAILGANASGVYSSVTEAMLQMGGSGTVVRPNLGDKRFHDAKYAAFLKMLECQQDINRIMQEV
ncbi:FGGY carbohydrate kinase domain-containing protein-like isoform X2 [Ornithodoros turicata]